MSRTRSSVVKKARVRKVLSHAKGQYGKRKNLYTLAKQNLIRAQKYAFIHRRKKKGDFRRLWIVRLNAALRPMGVNYSKFIAYLNKANIRLNRKSLSLIAHHDPEGFKEIVQKVKPS